MKLRIIFYSFLLLVSSLILSGCTLGTTYTLFVCDEVMENGVECYSNTIVLNDAFPNIESCIEFGKEHHPGNIFECGKNCNYNDEFDTHVCKEICTMKGVCY